jgi:NADH dehydrogenase
MSCQAAGQLGVSAAETVLSRVAGAEPAPLNVAFVASCVSVGRGAATVQRARKDDSPARLVIGGRTAAMIKEAVCRGTVWGIRREARKPGSTPVMKGPRPEQPAVSR